MRKQCERDVQLFALHFFPHHIRLPFGRMHREFFRLYRRTLNGHQPLEARPARRLAIAAPRGAAKSTLKSLILPIHATLYQRERYITILSATLKQARRRLRNIKAELEANEALREFFAKELRRRGSWTLKGLNINDVQIDIFSAGTEIRGISHGPWRPTLVILDDIEDSDAVRNPDQRENLLNWYNEVIENIGDSYTAIEIVGTLLHPDSLLANLLKRPDFESRVFRSIEQFAECADLWERWREIYANLSDPDRAETARRFFNTQRAEMLRGTRVLWQAKEDYYDLMIQMAARGRRAFFKEKQNEPAAAGDVFFDLARIVRFRRTGDTLEILSISSSSLADWSGADLLEAMTQSQEARNKKQEARDQKQEAGSKTQEARSQEQEAGNKRQDARSGKQEDRSETQDPAPPATQSGPAASPQSTVQNQPSTVQGPQSTVQSPTSTPQLSPPSSCSSFIIPRSSLIVAGFLDSAMGRGSARAKGDYAAIVTVGIDAAGYFYVLDAWVARAAPTAQIARLYDLHALWNYTFFGIEANCFQQLLLLPIEEERARRRAAGRPWQIPIREVHHAQTKEMRIATLEPLVANGWIRFDAALPELLWQQLESFPRGDHDDALDALEGAVALLRGLSTDARRGPSRSSLRRLSNY